MSLQINLGSVSSMCGELKFSFAVHNSGDAHVQIYAHDPTDMRKSGVLLFLGQSEYEKLKAVIRKTDETIEKMQASQQINKNLSVNLK